MEAVAAVIAASRNTRGSKLSPKLKDKHVQRLRALRQRLQALKLLRSWPLPGRAGYCRGNDDAQNTRANTISNHVDIKINTNNDNPTTTTIHHANNNNTDHTTPTIPSSGDNTNKSSSVVNDRDDEGNDVDIGNTNNDGVGGDQIAGESDRAGCVRYVEGENTLVGYEEHHPVEGAAESNDGGLTGMGKSSGGDNRENISDKNDDETHAENLAKDWPDHLELKQRDGASVEPPRTGRGSSDDEGKMFQAESGAVWMAGRNRLKTFENLGNSRQERPEDVTGCIRVSNHDSDQIRGDRDQSIGDGVSILLRTCEGTAGASGDDAGGNSVRSADREIGRHHVTGAQSPSSAGAVVHSTERPASQVSHGYRLSEGPPPGSGNGMSGGHNFNRGRLVDNSGSFEGARVTEEVGDGGNGATRDERSQELRRGVELQNTLRQGRGTVENRDQEATGSASNEALTTETLAAASGGGLHDIVPADHGENNSARVHGAWVGGSNQVATGSAYGRLDVDNRDGGAADAERVVSSEECAESLGDHRNDRSGTSDREAQHVEILRDDTVGDPMPIGNGGEGRGAEAAAVATVRKHNDGTGALSVHESQGDDDNFQVSDEVVGRWVATTPGGPPVDEGGLSFQPGEDPLDGDGSSTVSSISGQGWRHTEPGMERIARGTREQGGGRRARGVGAGVSGRHGRASGGADTDRGSDGLSSVEHGLQASPGQVNLWE